MKGPDFNIVKHLKSQKLDITVQQLLKLCPKEKSKVVKALQRPRDIATNLSYNEPGIEIAPLKCYININGSKIKAIVDSGAAGTILSRHAMEQIGYQIEETTNRNIISANGNRNKTLGKIKDLPIQIEDNVIPIDVEVMETNAYNILIGNDWLSKADATYNWKNHQLTVNWRNKTTEVYATYAREENDSEEEYLSEEEY
jgi:hypothetical protein